MMKIFPIICFACLAVCSPVVKNKRNKTKFNLNAYCDALKDTNVLINSSDHIPGQDPVSSITLNQLTYFWAYAEAIN